MAIQGKQVKNQILTDLLSWLWLGKVHRAIKVLQDVSQDQIILVAKVTNQKGGLW